MSVVTVQLGQCGNQIGLSFFQTLMSDIAQSTVSQHQDYNDECLERFFHRPLDGRSSKATPSARAVMVDMESKVIQNTVSIAKKSGTWRYPDKQQFCRKRGAGNNWADGFYGHGSAVEEQVLEMVQREVEKCDRFGGFLSLMSVAGGTGSGVGTHITQCLKDRYPQALLMNQLVWPHCSGEVILQNYNAVLSLAHLYESSDAINIIHNDHMRKICSGFSSGSSYSGVSFTDMNKLIAEQMALFLQPSHRSGRSTTLCDMLEILVSHPDYKLLTMYCVPQISEASLPFSTFAWPGLMKRLHQMVINASVMEEGLNWQVKAGSAQSNKCISNQLILRGKDSKTMADISPLQNSTLYVDWIPSDSAFACSHQSRQFKGYEKSACLMSNGKTPVGSLNTIVRKAWDMFAMRAYVHWYVRHGMEEEKFIDCFASLEQVLENYRQI